MGTYGFAYPLALPFFGFQHAIRLEIRQYGVDPLFSAEPRSDLPPIGICIESLLGSKYDNLPVHGAFAVFRNA